MENLIAKVAKMSEISAPANGALTIENPAVKEWLDGRFTKVCVSVDSEEELIDIYTKAMNRKVNVKLIKDAGLTEFGGDRKSTRLNSSH